MHLGSGFRQRGHAISRAGIDGAPDGVVEMFGRVAGTSTAEGTTEVVEVSVLSNVIFCGQN